MKAIQASVLVLLLGACEGARILIRDINTNYPKNLDEETITALALSDQANDEARSLEI